MTMAAAISQRAHRDSLLDANRAVINRIRQTVSSLPAETITRRPPNGGWSVAEVLEHLIVSADSYLPRISTLLHAKAAAVAEANTIWKPSLMGGLLTESQRSPRKMPTAKMYKPGPSPRPRVLDEFVQRQEDVGRLIAEAGGIDWKRARMSSPVMPLLRMNLGDALTLLVVHAERHAGQIERVLEQTATHAELAR
jgi:uncharacterized damage-inducible protein DinB